jgi:hypothetical protein
MNRRAEIATRHRLLVLVVFTLAQLLFSPSAPEALPAPGALTEPFGLQGLGGNCLDVQFANPNPETPVDNGKCNGSQAQVFRFVGSTIRSVWGQCLDVLRGDAAAGALDWTTCNGTASQNWHQVGQQILGLSAKCLDVQFGNSAPGATVDLASCNGTPAQNWQVINAPTILNGVGSKCLDVINSNTQPGARLQIFECNRGRNAQLFTFTAAGEIRNSAGLCLDLMFGNAQAGQVQMTTCNGTSSQQWLRQGRELRGPNSPQGLFGNCLSTVASYNANSPLLEAGADHTAVGLAPCSGVEAQQWLTSDLFQNGPSTLVIITSEGFQDTFASFIAHKNSIGIASTLLTMKSIDQDFPASDDALSLKKAIEFYYRNYGTNYVLLGGDTSQVPIRYRRTLDGGGITQSFVFSDLFYANLYSGHHPSSGFHGDFDSWDSNGNGLYNEQVWTDPLANPDNVDGFPDVAVGRIPAYDSTALQTILSKIIAYEMLNPALSGPGFPPSGRYGWAADACYPGSYAAVSQVATGIGVSLSSGSAFAEETGGQCNPTLPGSGWTIDTQGWTSFLSAVNGNNFEFITYIGHGGSIGWGYYESFNAGHVAQLTNRDSVIMIAAACQTAQFANVPVSQPLTYRPSVYDSNAVNYSKPSIGSQLLFKSNGGAVVYIGENEVEQDDVGTNFAQILFSQRNNGYSRLGDVWRMALQVWFNNNFDTPGFDPHFSPPRIFGGTMNLLGDPSMQLP